MRVSFPRHRCLVLVLAGIAACDQSGTPDGGVDVTSTDGTIDSSDATFAVNCSDAGLEEVALAPIPPSCAPCPPTMPESGSPCDSSIECEFGSDPRVGCNPMAVCGEPFPEAGLRWFDDPSATCGPIVRGSACSGACVDASVWCAGDDSVCQGPFANGDCQSFRDAALGCPCTLDDASVVKFGSMLCRDGRYVFPTPPLRP